MNIEEKYTLIEKYLAKELSGNELLEFEKQLEDDPELQEELVLHRQVAETLKGEKIHELRNVLKQVDKKWEAPRKEGGSRIVRMNFRRVLAIAATVLLFVLGYQFFLGQNNFSDQELFAQNFESYQMVLNQRSLPENDQSSELLNEAISKYNNKNFGEAATAFQQLQQDQPDNIALQFYEAMSLLSDKKSAAAIPVFKNIVEKKDHLFLEQSQWYLALAYLENGEKENAIKLLEKIQKEEYQFEAAQKLLNAF